ncbi:hypothetical protein [Candidatus Thiosymbion oneisti]|uniref:hypothetical protein n=1 Tax=Candidatus Thiosymbion oneisti TaxID=589554 RepID=UPI0013FDAA0A|nr:hypothetical protein [Candidatus Thiosymbion oneisti]
MGIIFAANERQLTQIVEIGSRLSRLRRNAIKLAVGRWWWWVGIRKRKRRSARIGVNKIPPFGSG